MTFGRNTAAYVRKTQHHIVSAWIGTAYTAADVPAANGPPSPSQLRPKARKLATLMDAAEEDVLVFIDFPREHRAKLQGTNLIARLNGEIKLRTDGVGIFPSEAPSSGSSALFSLSSLMTGPPSPSAT